MGYPSTGCEGCYRNRAGDVRRFLDTRHPNRYFVVNLCSEPGRSYPGHVFHDRVTRIGFKDHSAPRVAQLLQFCRVADDFLSRHPENVLVVHCKAGKGRTGVMIAAYLVHTGACPDANAALQYYAIQRTYNHSGVTIPSQRRFVRYYDMQVNAMRFQAERRDALHELVRVAAAAGGDDQADDDDKGETHENGANPGGTGNDSAAVHGEDAEAVPSLPDGAAVRPAPLAAESALAASATVAGAGAMDAPERDQFDTSSPPSRTGETPPSSVASFAEKDDDAAEKEDGGSGGDTHRRKHPLMPLALRRSVDLPLLMGPWHPLQDPTMIPHPSVVLTSVAFSHLPSVEGRLSIRAVGFDGEIHFDSRTVLPPAGSIRDVSTGVVLGEGAMTSASAATVAAQPPPSPGPASGAGAVQREQGGDGEELAQQEQEVQQEDNDQHDGHHPPSRWGEVAAEASRAVRKIGRGGVVEAVTMLHDGLEAGLVPPRPAAHRPEDLHGAESNAALRQGVLQFALPLSAMGGARISGETCIELWAGPAQQEGKRIAHFWLHTAFLPYPANASEGCRTLRSVVEGENGAMAREETAMPLRSERVGWWHIPQVWIDGAVKDRKGKRFPPGFSVTLFYEGVDPSLRAKQEVRRLLREAKSTSARERSRTEGDVSVTVAP